MNRAVKDGKQVLSERVFTSQVIGLAQRLGWLVAHFRAGMMRGGRWVTPCQGDAKGFPDLILVRGSCVIAAELKTDKGKTTPEQEIWLEAFRKAGGRGCTWRPSMIESIEIVLRRS